jgi:hypothetical protein
MKHKTSPPPSASEYWDAVERTLLLATPGEWVVVEEGKDTRRGGRNDKVRKNLARRGLEVEVMSRVGNGSKDRPWEGWRTWARVKS